MLFSKFFKSKKKNNNVDERVQSWMEKQSHLEDALTYLIEKELFEYGERDLSYVIPRMRNDAYFESLLQRESYDNRFHTNMDLYDSIASIHTEPHITPSQTMHSTAQSMQTASPVTTAPTPIDVHAAKKPSRPRSRNTSISSVNKRKPIYNTTTSAVVVTAPEEQYSEKSVDMTCFDD